MGFKPSPYMAVRFYYWTEEFARGNCRHKSNGLRWDCIVLNLPGSPSYDSTQLRMMKWDATIKKIAGDIAGYVDDLRPLGYSIKQPWAILRQIVSPLQYLGIQDAPAREDPQSGRQGLGPGQHSP
jgi:hypothetical protein